MANERILVVEDSRTQATALMLMLESEGFSVVIAKDGASGLRTAVAGGIDLVMSDIEMPGLNGYELCRSMKDTPQTKDLPVILLTATNNPMAIVKGIESGANGFLTKPYEAEDLLGLVNKLLHPTEEGSPAARLHGRRFLLGSPKQQMLDLLTSTFEEILTRNEELIDAKNTAVQQSHFKSNFLASMSHELRTPLNAIIGFSELLQDQQFGTLNSEQREFVDSVVSSGRHLLALINDILDLSRIEAGRMSLEKASIDVPQLVDGLRADLASLTFKKNNTLEITMEEGLPKLSADPTRFRQVLYNLLSNAIKFTPEGGRTILDVRREDSKILTSVSDTGIGIKEKDLPRLFKEFERIESDGPRVEGTGLGLAVTKRIVDLHGGSISVTSTFGKGSTFSVLWPAA